MVDNMKDFANITFDNCNCRISFFGNNNLSYVILQVQP